MLTGLCIYFNKIIVAIENDKILQFLNWKGLSVDLQISLCIKFSESPFFIYIFCPLALLLLIFIADFFLHFILSDGSFSLNNKWPIHLHFIFVVLSNPFTTLYHPFDSSSLNVPSGFLTIPFTRFRSTIPCIHSNLDLVSMLSVSFRVHKQSF